MKAERVGVTWTRRLLNTCMREGKSQRSGRKGDFTTGGKRGRGTADGMFTLRQLVEKRLEGPENMALGIIALEKAYGTVP